MIIPDHDITVNYYRVREDTPLYAAIISYHKKCTEFAQYAEGLVAKYDADSAIRLHDFFGMRISGLNFSYEKAPLHWHMDSFGDFKPKWNSREAEDFRMKLSYFREHYPDAPEGLRFGTLGDAVVISVTPNKDGTVSKIADAELLDETSLEALKSKASDQEKEHIEQLSRYHWTPAPLWESKAFTASEEVQKLNQERWDFAHHATLLSRHSRVARGFNRLVSKFGVLAA